MKLNKLSLKDKRIFVKYLGLSRHELSVYSFENIYIWKGLYQICWKLIEDSLCIFFKDKLGCFLYLPPLAKKIKPEVIEEAFKIMDSLNKNKDISRIENIEETDRLSYKDLGYAPIYKGSDYLCKRIDLAQLKGNRFKSKRACLNYFAKHYEFAYLAFSSRYKNDCLRLYDQWMRQRLGREQNPIYQGMLADSRICLKILLKDYRDLDLVGRVVKIVGEVKAFTFGFRLNPEAFCILYEVTDLSIKGLAQFIFREFCAELKDCPYINIMDDSGLENLKKVKLSYHPLKLALAYITTRKNAQ